MRLLLLVLLFCSSLTVNAQFPGCPNVDAGPDQTLNCSTTCATLTATPFDVGATTSYSVSSIPHTPPIAYNAAGNAVSVNTDDVWSPAINLPFNFCFYGVNYTQIVVGANGNLSFNTANASGYCPWSFTASCPSPNLVSAGNIFGVYHDIDPSVCGNIKWNISGTAPCRIFTVSYDQVCHFSCTTIKSRHMIVLYETTNVIDVYVQTKPTCSGWNGGRAIIGIQDMTGNVGIAAPNRNATPNWTVTTAEGWRFKPNGSPIYAVTWLNGTNVIGNTNTINVCPTVATTYTARATYTRCDGTTVVEEDQVVINPANSGLTLTQTANSPAICGQPNGSFTVSASGGTPGYTYSLNNSSYQSNNTFSGLSAGNYTVSAQDAGGCSTTLNVVINTNSTLNLSVSQLQNVNCNGMSTGSITTLTTGGTSPYQYTINGISNGSSGVFSNLQDGNYSITVTDNSGCTFNLNTSITEPPAITLNQLSTSNATCNQNNGAFEVAGAGGVAPYSYSINNGLTSQPSPIFSMVAPATYTVLLTDNNGCTNSIPVTVLSNATPTISIVSSNNVSCFGGNDGATTVTSSNGLPPYSFTVNSGTPQASGVFNNLTAGNYNFTVTDANGCNASITGTITSPALLQLDINQIQHVQCNGGSNGLISTQATGGSLPYTYTLNSISNGSSGLFTNLQVGNYTVIVTDNLGCSATISASINQPSALNLSLVASTNSTCNLNNGSLEVVGSGGALPYSFSINNGTSSQTSPVFSMIGPAVYTVSITDDNGCSTSIPVTVSADPAPTISLVSTTNISCFGGSNGSIEVTGVGGVAPLTYSLNGGWQQSSTIFSGLTSGNYTVGVVDANGCLADVAATLTQPQLLILETSPDTEICSGSQVQIQATSAGGVEPYSYNWSSGQTVSSINVSPLTTTVYSLTLTDANGCVANSQSTVTVLSLPIALGDPSVITGYLPLTVNFDNLSSNADYFIWDFGNGGSLSTSSTTDANVVYANTGTYNVTLTASNGICDSTWTVLITVIPYEPLEVDVPNVFSPNADGTNDFYFISTKNASSIEGVIIDRWGLVMVEFDDLNYQWDGKVNGNDVVEGTYFIKYFVTGLDQTSKEGHTFFHLVR